MGYEDHQKQAGHRSITCGVITCSDSRTRDNDTSGDIIHSKLKAAGHSVSVRAISKDDPTAIRDLLNGLAGLPAIQAIILNGGTGVSRRDNTFDAVSSLLTKTLPGFGELFRMLSYEAIGSGAMLSRATAGIIVSPDAQRHTVLFSLPGSPNAVELAMDKLILPELSHLVWELAR